MTEQKLTNFVSFYYDDTTIKLAMVTNVVNTSDTITVRAFDQKANKYVEFKSITKGAIYNLITTCVVGDLIGYKDSVLGYDIKDLEKNFSHEQRLNNLRATYNAVHARQM